VMVDALWELDFEVDVRPDPVEECNRTITVVGRGGKIPAKKAELYVGNAGTAARFLTALVCLGHGEYTIRAMSGCTNGRWVNCFGCCDNGELRSRRRTTDLPAVVHAEHLRPRPITIATDDKMQPLRVAACSINTGALANCDLSSVAMVIGLGRRCSGVHRRRAIGRPPPRSQLPIVATPETVHPSAVRASAHRRESCIRRGRDTRARQEPRGRARIANIQLGFLRGNLAAASDDRDVRLHSSTGSGRTSTSKSSSQSASTITCVSCAHNAPLNVHSLSDSAAMMSARLVMLLDPGTVIVPFGGFASGWISRMSGRDFIFAVTS